MSLNPENRSRLLKPHTQNGFQLLIDFAEFLPPNLTEKSYHRQFVSAVNHGLIFPFVSPPDSEIHQKLLVNPKIILTSAKDDLLHSIWKYTTRFNPNSTPQEIKEQVKSTLTNHGMDPDKPVSVAINNVGNIGYFPTGVSTDGRLLIEKVLYFPQTLHETIMQASSWKQISDDAREGIARMHLYSVGLSVGSMLIDTAARMSVTRFTLGDPSLNHADASERLTYYRPEYKGWGKTPTAVWEILRRNPYAQIEAYYDGLTVTNGSQFFSSVTNSNEIPICAEEVDTWEGKVLSRKQPRILLAGRGIPTVMIGDVGPSDIVFTIDHPYSIPFNNRVGEADPKQDPYGSHLVAKKGNLAALFASIGGITYIPETSALLPLIRSGVIGTDITTVPQAWGAVLMAGAAFYEVLIATAENREQEIRDIVGLTIRDQISLSSK